MNHASHIRDHHAFLARLGTRAAKRYERRNAPDLAETIGKIADGFEEHKQTVRELQQRLDRAETKLARPGVDTRSAEKDGTSAMSLLSSKVSDTERKAFNNLLRTGDARAVAELRGTNISAGTTNNGLEAVAPWFDAIVRMLAIQQIPLLRRVRIQPVGNFPARIVFSNNSLGFQWAGEQSARNDTASPDLPFVEVAAGEWAAIPTVTEWALQDLFFDVESWLRMELANNYGGAVQAAIVAGNGVNKPLGFLSSPSSATADGVRPFGTLRYFATGAASTLPTTTSALIDFLLDVVGSLRPMYRQSPGCAWTMNAATLSTLRKYKDADGRPILIESMITGVPSTLLGYPVEEVEDMPAIAANAFPIAFGDWASGYVLCEEAQGMRITRDEITRPGFVRYYSRRRLGGKVTDSNAIRLVKVATS